MLARIEHCNIGDQGLELLTKFLASSKSLRSLNLCTEKSANRV